MPRVMIVDDDRTTVTLLETLLSLDGFDVSRVGRGGDVLNRARQDSPDVFLIDFHLTDMDGSEVVGILRSTREFEHTPIVIASGMNVEQEALQSGATLFLLKPLEPATLATTLKSLL
ncbi:MAG: response regulator [Anaerolineae bacterium]|nr:response regulator [Anaerolineae bacterium]